MTILTRMPGALETWDDKSVQDWLADQPALSKYTAQLEVGLGILQRVATLLLLPAST